MNITVADAAIKVAITKYGRFLTAYFGHQPPVSFKGGSIRQQNAGQIVQIPERITGEFQLKIDAAHIHRVIYRTDKGHPRIS
ncbi:hypothetical protein D3C73_1327780 [compost metagenome]